MRKAKNAADASLIMEQEKFDKEHEKLQALGRRTKYWRKAKMLIRPNPKTGGMNRSSGDRRGFTVPIL